MVDTKYGGKQILKAWILLEKQKQHIRNLLNTILL